MKRTVLKFGFFGLITALILFSLALVFAKSLDYSTQEIIGYLTMAASLIFTYFGIKHYRDKENNGAISIGKALQIGLLISIFAGLGFGIVDYIYTTMINPDFAVEYQEHMLSSMREELPAEEFAIKSEELKQQMKDYGSPSFMAFIMFFSVVIIGFIISLISALILQRKN